MGGGWSYPGFSGLEGGLEFLYNFENPASFSLALDLLAGFYKYNLTPNYFFIPSVKLTPGWTVYRSESIQLDAILPLKYYIRTDGILFLSLNAGLRISL